MRARRLSHRIHVRCTRALQTCSIASVAGVAVRPAVASAGTRIQLDKQVALRVDNVEAKPSEVVLVLGEGLGQVQSWLFRREFAKIRANLFSHGWIDGIAGERFFGDSRCFGAVERDGCRVAERAQVRRDRGGRGVAAPVQSAMAAGGDAGGSHGESELASLARSSIGRVGCENGG